MSAAVTTKYWMSTVSREHVLIGVEGGFCQVCHGKKGPLARMKEGDWLIYYSPKESLGGNMSCQKFTAIGKIADNHIYQFQMSDNFIPFRRNVTYLQDVKDQSIRPLLEKLTFTQGKANWGMQFRMGLFEISKNDFELIKQHMEKE